MKFNLIASSTYPECYIPVLREKGYTITETTKINVCGDEETNYTVTIGCLSALMNFEKDCGYPIIVTTINKTSYIEIYDSDRE